MCGRIACTLKPDQLAKKCEYKEKDGKICLPEWSLNKQKYKPSYNIAPQSYCPVLIASRHLALSDCEHVPERVIACMKWGLVPAWINPNDKKMSFSMNNARSDTMLEKKSYKAPLKKGQRCVVLIEGFYEWKTYKNNKKQPYYIQFSNNNDTSIMDYESVPLLTIAGIFEKTYNDITDEDVYSFTIITVESHEKFSDIHHRMPAVLETADEVTSWLNSEEVSLETALKLIKPNNCISWYPVSKFVSNSKNQGEDCRKRISEEEVKKAAMKNVSASTASMMSWIRSSQPQHSSISCSKKQNLKRPRNNIEKWFVKKPKS